jgi:hypothetical protein
MDAQIVLHSTALFQQGVKSKEPLIRRAFTPSHSRAIPLEGAAWNFGGTSSQVAETQVSEKSLALIGNASGQDAEGAINCSEAFSTRRLEGRRSQWWVLLWICGQDSAPVNEGKSLEMGVGRRG